jgi:hypothetical protein
LTSARSSRAPPPALRPQLACADAHPGGGTTDCGSAPGIRRSTLRCRRRTPSMDSQPMPGRASSSRGRKAPLQSSAQSFSDGEPLPAPMRCHLITNPERPGSLSQRWANGGQKGTVLSWENVGEGPSTLKELYPCSLHHILSSFRSNCLDHPPHRNFHHKTTKARFSHAASRLSPILDPSQNPNRVLVFSFDRAPVF